MAVTRTTSRRRRDRGTEGSTTTGERRSGFGVHWLLTGLLLGGGCWTLIGAGVAAAFGAWLVAGLLVAATVALLVTLVLLAVSSARLRRTMEATAERPEPAQKSRLRSVPRPGRVA